MGRPPPRVDAADYVLKDFSRSERKELEFLLPAAADAVELILREGVVSAMNRCNVKSTEAEEV